MGSRNTEVSSSNVISGGAVVFSGAMEMDEDDEEGEEDIVSSVLSDGLEGIKFSRWCR